ncbi:MAG: acyltransferase [Chthoniobacteraceae bacterium]
MKRLAQRLKRALLEDTSTSGTKFDALDGLRGVAVLTVFISHTSAAGQQVTPWTNFHGTGHLGVYLFFVLSGFLLGYSLLHRPIYFGRFYLRRFFRIAPLYYLVVTAVYVVQKVTKHRDKTALFINYKLHGYVAHLLFYQGDSVFWSVAAEFEFYFILPFFVLFLNKQGNRAAWTLAALAVGYFAWAMAVVTKLLPPTAAPRVADILQPSQYLDVFLCGILAAYVYTNKKAHHWYTTHKGWLNPASAALAALVALVSAVGVGDNFFGLARVLPIHVGLDASGHLAQLATATGDEFSGATRGIPILHFFSLGYGIAFSLILLATLYGSPVLVKALRFVPLRVIGVTGFSWYLLHLPLVRVVGRMYRNKAPETLMFATSFLLVGTVAIVSYLTIEKPFMMMSRMFSGRKPAPAAAPIESAAPL